ncbi:VCBS repeat containing protein, partial [Hyalomma marginatum]
VTATKMLQFLTMAQIQFLFVLLGNGDGTFKATMSYNVGAAPSGVTVGDFNHDRKQDIVYNGATMTTSITTSTSAPLTTALSTTPCPTLTCPEITCPSPSSTIFTTAEPSEVANSCNTNYTGAIVGSVIGGTFTICLSVLTYMWLIKHGSARMTDSSPNPSSYEVVVPAALSMTDMGEYLNSLNTDASSIKANPWDETSYGYIEFITFKKRH